MITRRAICDACGAEVEQSEPGTGKFPPAPWRQVSVSTGDSVSTVASALVCPECYSDCVDAIRDTVARVKERLKEDTGE